MSTIKVAVHGLGNIGKAVIDCLLCARDFDCLGVVRRASSLGTQPLSLRGVPDYASIDALMADGGKPDVVIVCGPSRNVPKDVRYYLEKNINTVDSFDIHPEITQVVAELDTAARAAGKAP